MDELKNGEFFPLLRTQIKCKIQIFSDKLHPWINDIPEEPIKPTEVTRDDEFLYTEIAAEERRQMEMQEMGSVLELSGDKTNDFFVRNSIEYASEH